MRKLFIFIAIVLLSVPLSAQIDGRSQQMTLEWEGKNVVLNDPSLNPFDRTVTEYVVIPQKPHKRQFVLFGHAPKGLFPETVDSDKTIQGVFLWSLDAVVSGAEITYNKELSVFETKFLSGVGGAVGWKHYKPLPDGSAISDWGLNFAVLTQVKINEAVKTGVELALLANVYNFTAGPVYIFSDKRLGLLVGGSIRF